MNSAEEIARIKAVRAALCATWETAVRARLEQGPATSHDLGKLVGANGRSGFWNWLRHSQDFAVRLGRAPGPTGHENILWTLKGPER